MAKKVVNGFENPEVIKEIIIADREKMPVRGGYMIRTQIMSDDIPDDTFMDQFVTKYQDEVNEYLKKFPESSKTELIHKWRARIETMSRQIKAIRKDSSLTDEEKKKKIARRLEIIANDQHSIQQTVEYLAHRDDPVKNLIERKNQYTK